MHPKYSDATAVGYTWFNPIGVAFDSDNRIYVSDQNRISELTDGGLYVTAISGSTG